MKNGNIVEKTLGIAGFAIIAAVAVNVGACTDNQAAGTGATAATGVSAVSQSASSVAPQRGDDALDAAAVTSGPGVTSGATMPAVGSGAVSGVGSGAGSAGTGR